MEGMKDSNGNNNNKKKPFSLMDSSSLPLVPSSFQVWKKPYSMNYGDSGASSSGTKPSHPPPLSYHLSMVHDDDNNKTSGNRNPSPPSDHKMVISSSGDDTAAVDTRWTYNVEHSMDPKRLRRIASNRVSAQKSRMKKLQYVTDMEQKAKAFETEIALLTPQVSLYQNQQEFLQKEHRSLNQLMNTYNTNSLFTNAEIAKNKEEVARLRQLHLSQQQHDMQGQNRLPVWECGLDKLMNSCLCPAAGPGQMVYANPNQGNYYNGESIEEILQRHQHKMKQVPVQCVDDNHSATNMPMMPGWGTGTGQMPGWGTGTGQMPNPSWIVLSGPPENANMIINSNQGGVEQILSLNNNMDEPAAGSS